MNKKLWTKRTARQELLGRITNLAAVDGTTINDALETAFDGDPSKAPEGSVLHGMWTWWQSASTDAQIRLLREARSIARADDRLMGRKIER